MAILKKSWTSKNFSPLGLKTKAVGNIGNIAGVEYVCYGTIKEIENGYTVSDRVVDVESGEICAMNRTKRTKDSYLEGVASGDFGFSKKIFVISSCKKAAEQSVGLPDQQKRVWRLHNLHIHFKRSSEWISFCKKMRKSV